MWEMEKYLLGRGGANLGCEVEVVVMEVVAMRRVHGRLG